MFRYSIIYLFLFLQLGCNPLGSVDDLNTDAILSASPPGAFDDEEWVLVPANTGSMGLEAFYIMKYEAKPFDEATFTYEADGILADETTHLPKSVAENTPWRSITADDAQARCTARGANYDIVSNAESMAIARDIEFNSENWSSGIVGDGCVFEGNSGGTDACSYNGDDPESGVGRDSKTLLYLSNGLAISDFDGNLWEWNDWDADTVLFQLGATTCTNSNVQTFSCGDLDDDDWRPGDPINHGTAESMGYVYGGSGGAAVRGGSYGFPTQTGIYSLSLTHNNTSYTNSYIGFRCVYRP